MIKRKPKPTDESVEVAKRAANEIVAADRFDNDDGAFEHRASVITKNLLSLSATVKHNGSTAKPAAAKAKPKVEKKPTPKQTKKPSQKKAEAEQKKKPAPKAKVKPGQKSPAARTSKVGGDTPKTRTAGKGGGGGSRTPARKAPATKEHITVRWAKMSTSAKASYIQSHAGKSVKTADADEALAKIWNKMSEAQQRAHLKRHPNSRLKMRAGGKKEEKAAASKKSTESTKAKKPAVDPDLEIDDEATEGTVGPGPSDDKPAEWWADQSADFQQNYLNKYPDSKFSKRHRSLVRNIVSGAGDKIKSEARKMGTDYHQGMGGLRAWRNGEKMTEDQKEGLKNTSIKVGSLLVLALVTVAIFTPLGPAAMEFGETWWNEREHGGSSLSSEESTSGVNLEGHEKQDPKTKAAKTEDDEQLAWMTQDMTKFLLAQKDVAGFAKKISKAK